MNIRPQETVLLLGALVVPLAASRIMTGDFSGGGSIFGNVNDPTLRSVTLAGALGASLYAVATGSEIATAVGVGLLGSTAIMYGAESKLLKA